MKDNHKALLILSVCSNGRNLARVFLLFATFFLLGFVSGKDLRILSKTIRSRPVPQSRFVPSQPREEPLSPPHAIEPETIRNLPKDPMLRRLEERHPTPFQQTPIPRTHAADWIARGRNMTAIGQWEEAVETLERGLQLSKEGSEDQHQALMALGVAEKETGRYRTAANRFSRVLELWDDEEAKVALAEVRILLRYPEGTPTPVSQSPTTLELLMASAHELSPQEQQALDWLLKSKDLQDRERWDESIESVERAIQLTSEGSDLHRECLLLLACSEWSSERRLAAKRTFDQVSKLWGAEYLEPAMQRLQISSTEIQVSP